MSKKESLKNDGFGGLDDDLNFEDFDYGEVESKTVKPKGRTVIGNVFRGTISGAKDTVFNKNIVNKVLKKTLPKEYGEITNSLDEVADGVGTIYADTVKTVKPTINKITREVDKLIPNEMKRTKGFLNKLKELSGNDQTSSPSAEQLREENIGKSLADIFAATTEQSISDRARDRAETSIKDQIDTDRHKVNFTALNSINVGVSKLAAYNERINAQYQKKSLELQLRSYYTQIDLLETNKKFYEIFKSQNDAVVKNTSLPEYLKITNSEKFAEMTKTKLFGSMGSAIFSKDGMISKGFKKFGRKVKDKVDDFKSALEMGLSGVEMMNMNKEMEEMDGDMGGSSTGTSGMIGNFLGAAGIDHLLNKLGLYVNKNYVKGSKLEKGLKIGAGHAADTTGLINMLLNSKHLEDDGNKGPLGMMKDMARMFLTSFKPDKINTTIDSIGPHELSHPSIFDNQTRKSIVEVIPGYLARILRELSDVRLRSGKKGFVAELTEYDYDNNKFDESKNITAAITKSFINASNVSSFNNSEQELKKHIIGNKVVDSKVEAGVIKVIRSVQRADEGFGAAQYTDEKHYKDLDKDIKKKVEKLIRSRFDYTVGNINADNAEDETILKRLSVSHADSYKDLRGQASSVINRGQAHHLDPNLVKRDKDGKYRFNLEAGRRIVEEHSDSLDQKDETKKYDAMMNDKFAKMMEGELAVPMIGTPEYKELLKWAIKYDHYDEGKGDKPGKWKKKNSLFIKSDINVKDHIVRDNPKDTLSTFSKLPVYSWKYKQGEGEGPYGHKYTGPMAQDMKEAFGNGTAPHGQKIDLISISGKQSSAIGELARQTESLKQDQSGSSSENTRLITEAIAKSSSDIIEKLETLKVGLSSVVLGSISSLLPDLTMDEIKSRLKDTADIINEKGKQAKQRASKLTKGILGRMSNKLREHGYSEHDSLLGAASGLGAHAGAIVLDTFDLLGSLLGKGTKFTKKFARKGYKRTKKFYNKNKHIPGDLLNNIKQRGYNQLDQAEDVYSQAKGTVNDVIDKTNLSDRFNRYKGKATSLMSNIRGRFNNYNTDENKSRVMSKGKSILGGIASGASGLLGGMFGKGRSLLSGIGGWFKKDKDGKLVHVEKPTTQEIINKEVIHHPDLPHDAIVPIDSNYESKTNLVERDRPNRNTRKNMEEYKMRRSAPTRMSDKQFSKWQENQDNTFAKMEADKERRNAESKAKAAIDLTPKYMDGKKNSLTDIMSKAKQAFNVVSNTLSNFGNLFSKVGRLGKLAKTVTGGIRSAGGLLRGGAAIAEVAAGVGEAGSIVAGATAATSTVAGAATAGAVVAETAAVATGATTLGVLTASGLAALGVLTGVATVGVAAYGIYKGGKYLVSKESSSDIEEARMLQYGLSKDNSMHYHMVYNLESYLTKAIRFEDDRASIDKSKIKVDDILEIFGVTLDSYEGNAFLKWYDKRFKPVFLTHITAINAITKKTDLDKVNSLSDEDKLKYLTSVIYPEGPYDIDTSPFIDVSVLKDATKDHVRLSYSKLIDKLKDSTNRNKNKDTLFAGNLTPEQKAQHDKLVKETKEKNDIEKAKGPSVWKLIDKNLGISSFIDSITPSKQTVEVAVGAIAAGYAASLLFSNPVGLAVGAISLIGYGAFKGIQYYNRRNPADIELLRFLQYGFKESNNKHFPALYNLEVFITDKVGIKYRDETPSFTLTKENLQEIYNAFGISDYESDRINKFNTWFNKRFKPVFLTHIAALKHVDREKELRYVDNLKDDEMMDYIKGVGFLEGPYDITESPFEDITNLTASRVDVKYLYDVLTLAAKVKIKIKSERSPTFAPIAKDSTSKGIDNSKIKSAQDAALAKYNQDKINKTTPVASTSTTAANVSTTPSTTGNGINTTDAAKSTSLANSVPTTSKSIEFSKARTVHDADSFIALSNPKDSKDIEATKDIIRTAAAQAGVDADLLLTFAQAESGMNQLTSNSKSTAKGPFQFVDKTWNGMLANQGKYYGMNKQNASPDNIHASAIMAGELMKANLPYLKKVKNNITASDVYLSHMLGGGGAAVFLSGPPNAIAADHISNSYKEGAEQVKSNWDIFYDKSNKPYTIAQVYENINTLMLKRAKQAKANIEVASLSGASNVKTSTNVPIADPTPITPTRSTPNTPSVPTRDINDVNTNITTVSPDTVSTTKVSNKPIIAPTRSAIYTSNNNTTQSIDSSIGNGLAPVVDGISKSNNIQTEMLSVLKDILKTMSPEAISALINKNTTTPVSSTSKLSVDIPKGPRTMSDGAIDLRRGV